MKFNKVTVLTVSNTQLYTLSWPILLLFFSLCLIYRASSNLYTYTQAESLKTSKVDLMKMW